MDATIGRTLKHYILEEYLGRGGMGVVYRARDTRLQRPVALKLLRPDLVADPGRKSRFLQEARAAAPLTHPAIAQIYDVDEADGDTFIAMEFIDGKTITRLVADGELDLMGAVEIAIQAAEGLARAHDAGLVHRDIKSDNIMVTRDGHAKILDFGLAKLMDDGADSPASARGGESRTETFDRTQTMAGTVKGTINYMSPEQARGRAVSPASDLFSLGVVLYEMVTGDRPFKGETPLDTMHSIAYEEPRPVTLVRRNMPEKLHRIIARCLRKKPEDRYPDARALAADLKDLKRDLDSGVSRPLPAGDRVRGWLDRLGDSFPLGRNGVLILAAALVLSIVLFAARFNWGNLVPLGAIGFLFYRSIRNKKTAKIKAAAGKISKDPLVRAVLVQGERITVIVDRAAAGTNVRITSLIDAINKRRFLGRPVAAEIRDGVSEKEFQSLLRTPGVVYAREDAGPASPAA